MHECNVRTIAQTIRGRIALENHAIKTSLNGENIIWRDYNSKQFSRYCDLDSHKGLEAYLFHVYKMTHRLCSGSGLILFKTVSLYTLYTV